MDFLHKCYAIIKYRNRVVRLQFQNKLGKNENGVVEIQKTKAESHPQQNGVDEHPKRNQFYALKLREEQEKSTDVDNANSLVFSFLVYALLDPGSCMFMETLFVANKFDLLSEILHEPFLVSTPVGDSVKAEGVCREVDGIVENPFEIMLGVIRFKS